MTKGKIISAVALVIGLVLVLVWVQGGFHSKVPGGGSQIKDSAPEGLETFKVEAVKTKGEVTVSGTVESIETARIAPRVQGEVVEITVEEGDEVEKGQLLVKIHSSEMKDRVAQAKAELESAKAGLTTARLDFQRYKSLYEKDSIAKKTFDDAKSAYEAAQAKVKSAQAAVEEAETMLSYTELKAPFKGIVGSREVNLGDMAAVSRTLMTVYMPDELELVASAGEQYAAYLEVSNPVKLEVPSLGLKQESKIKEVAAKGDEITRTITVKAPLKKAKGLRPGLYGSMTFPVQMSKAIRIPKNLVKRVGQLETVNVLRNGRIEVQSVKTGRSSGDMVDVLSGLAPGDRVVVPGK